MEKKTEPKAGIFLPRTENQAPMIIPVEGVKVCCSSGAKVN